MITNLTIGRYGRFANMLFQIAAVVGIARKSGQPYGFPQLANYDHKERFGSTEEIDFAGIFSNPFPRLNAYESEFQRRDYSWGYHDIYLPAGRWNITGHFQSEKYFKHCIDEVRQLFTQHVDSKLHLTEWVGIHVRRGDYDDVYHTHMRKDYYDKARAQFPTNTHFVVFSDDHNAAREILGEDHTDYMDDGAPYYWDFARLKHCRHFITANSSFSLMAAILGAAPDKKIVCPRAWFGPAWNPSTADLYPAGAIVL